MKCIRNIFNSFFKFGNIFGFYPFQFNRDDRTELSLIRSIYSALISLFFIIMFLFFINSAIMTKSPGSEFSTLTAILSSLISVTTGIFITGTNFLYYENFEQLFNIFRNFDMKVIYN